MVKVLAIECVKVAAINLFTHSLRSPSSLRATAFSCELIFICMLIWGTMAIDSPPLIVSLDGTLPSCSYEQPAPGHTPFLTQSIPQVRDT